MAIAFGLLQFLKLRFKVQISFRWLLLSAYTQNINNGTLIADFEN